MKLRNMFEYLPLDLLHHISTFLEIPEIGRLRTTCSNFVSVGRKWLEMEQQSRGRRRIKELLACASTRLLPRRNMLPVNGMVDWPCGQLMTIGFNRSYDLTIVLPPHINIRGYIGIYFHYADGRRFRRLFPLHRLIKLPYQSDHEYRIDFTQDWMSGPLHSLTGLTHVHFVGVNTRFNPHLEVAYRLVREVIPIWIRTTATNMMNSYLEGVIVTATRELHQIEVTLIGRSGQQEIMLDLICLDGLWVTHFQSPRPSNQAIIYFGRTMPRFHTVNCVGYDETGAKDDLTKDFLTWSPL